MARTKEGKPARRTDQDLIARLLRLVNLAAKPFFTEYATRYHLSINDWRVMRALAEHAGLAASDICDLTGMHPMNVSRSVAQLERRGRVQRHADPQDRRRNLLRLTRSGRAVFGSIAPAAQAREELVRSALNPREAAQLGALLDRLIERISTEDSAAAPPAARKRAARRLRISLG